MDIYLIESKKLFISLVIPKFMEYVKNKSNIDEIDETELIEFLNSGNTNSLNYTVTIKCGYISNKGKACPRRAQIGKNFCPTHIEKDKKKGRKNIPKKIIKSDYRESEITDMKDSINMKIINRNLNLFMNLDDDGIVYYKLTNNPCDDFVIIGKYPSNEPTSDIIKNLSLIQELTNDEIQNIPKNFKYAYEPDKINFLIEEANKLSNETILDNESKSLEESNKKKRGRKPKNDNVVQKETVRYSNNTGIRKKQIIEDEIIIPTVDLE